MLETRNLWTQYVAFYQSFSTERNERKGGRMNKREGGEMDKKGG
jgi:hypothetical protein